MKYYSVFELGQSTELTGQTDHSFVVVYSLANASEPDQLPARPEMVIASQSEW